MKATDYIICKLAAERCQNNLAHICALVHLSDERDARDDDINSIKNSLLVLIDAVNCDLQSIDTMVQKWSEREERKLTLVSGNAG